MIRRLRPWVEPMSGRQRQHHRMAWRAFRRGDIARARRLLDELVAMLPRGENGCVGLVWAVGLAEIP